VAINILQANFDFAGWLKEHIDDKTWLSQRRRARMAPSFAPSLSCTSTSGAHGVSVQSCTTRWRSAIRRRSTRTSGARGWRPS
jgi:hypothetical protein